MHDFPTVCIYTLYYGCCDRAHPGPSSPLRRGASSRPYNINEVSGGLDLAVRDIDVILITGYPRSSSSSISASSSSAAAASRPVSCAYDIIL